MPRRGRRGGRKVNTSSLPLPGHRPVLCALDQSPLARVLDSVSASTNKQELVIEYTFYNDLYFGKEPADVAAKPVQAVWFKLLQNPASSLPSDIALGRIDRCRAYVLPNTNIGAGTPGYEDAQVDASFMLVAACPASAPLGSTTTYPAANTKTLVLPSLTPTWKKVLDWHSSSVFADANLEPKISTGASIGAVQAVSMVGAFDTSSGAVYGRTVQMMHKVLFRMPLGVRNTIDCGFVEMADFSGNLSAPTTTEVDVMPVQLVVRGVSDKI